MTDDEQMKLAVATLVEKLTKMEFLTDSIVSNEIIATGDLLGFTVENGKRGTFYFKVWKQMDEKMGRVRPTAEQSAHQDAPPTVLPQAETTKSIKLLAMKIGNADQFSKFVQEHGLVEQTWSGTDMWNNLLKFNRSPRQNVYSAYKRGLDWYIGLCPSDMEMDAFYQYYRSGSATNLRFFVGNLPDVAFQQGYALN